MVLELIGLVKVLHGSHVLLYSRWRRVHVLARLLSLGPNDTHQIIDNTVIGGLTGDQLAAEDDRGHAVLFESCGTSQIKVTTVELVSAWCRPVSGVIIPDTTGGVAGRSNDNVSAVHGVEVVDGGPFVEFFYREGWGFEGGYEGFFR